MKKLLSALTMCLTIYAFSQKGNQTTLKAENLKGPIYSILEMSYGAKEKFGSIEKTGFSNRFFYTYNEAGNILEKSQYDKNGLTIVKWTYKYENELQVSEYITVNSSDPAVYLLYGDGKTTNFKYDSKGFLIERNEFSNSGNLLSKGKFKNNANGSLVESNIYYGNGNLQFRFVLNRSKSGKVFENKRYDPNGNLIEKKQFKYDEKGRIASEDSYNKSNVLDASNKFKYDSKGNIVSNTFHYSTGAPDFKLTYKYEYDKFGNWITLTEFEDGIPKKVTERNIEYYQ